MNSILGAVVNGMIVSAGLAGAVRVALWLMPTRLLNAATRYAIWWVVMAAVVLLPLAYAPFDSGRVVITAGRPGVAATVPRARNRSMPIVPPASPLRYDPRPALVLPAVRARVISRPLFPVAIAAGAWSWRIVWFWLGISALMVLRLVVSIAMLERRKARADAAPAALTHRILGWLRWRRDVRVLCSSEIPIPVAAGPCRPSILLPSRLAETLSEDELAQIGIHEAGHLARRDDYALLIQRGLEALLALHPVVWWVSRRIDLEREIACDDLVVEATGDAQPYAACLARVVELSGVVRAVPTAAAATDRSHLARRVAMLLDPSRNRGTGLSKLRLISALVCVAGISWGGVQGRRFVAFTNRHVSLVKFSTSPQVVTMAQAGQSTVPQAVDSGRSARLYESEKEIIAATLHQMSDDTGTAQQAVEMGKSLAAAQASLHAQVLEMQAAGEVGEEMTAAADAMRAVVEQLKVEKWKDAAVNEQVALQQLLRADSALRDVAGQVAETEKLKENLRRQTEELSRSVAQLEAARQQDAPQQQWRQRAVEIEIPMLQDLTRKLRQETDSLRNATQSQVSEASETERLAETLLARVQEQLREIAVAQADAGPLPGERGQIRPFGGGGPLPVFIPAEVSDPMGRFVTGLDQDAFHVREDGVDQSITEVLGNDEPTNVFLVRDSRFPAEVDLVHGLVVPYETMPGKVLETVRTMSQLASTRVYGRKIAMIVAGSSENISNYTETELRAVLGGLRMPAFVFVVAEPGDSGHAGILNEIAERSGGRYVPVGSASDVAAAIHQVLPEVANLYFVGYVPVNAARDGGYRNVRVTIQAPRGLPVLSVHGASGYVAASR